MENEKNGTRWTGDGEGATVGTLHDKAFVICDVLSGGHHEVYAALYGVSCSGNWRNVRTNLALTGSPLTSEDIERILSASFKVGKGGAE